MRRIAHRTAGPLFTLLTALSLAFGARTALAEAPSAAACPAGPPWAGSCTSNEHCTEKCRVYGGDPIGECTTFPANCCVCSF